MKYVIIGLLVTSIPFFVLCFGFIFSLSRRGPLGVEWRKAIAYTVDLVLAACCGFARLDKLASISGWVGYKAVKSNNKRWDMVEKMIDLIPWFEDNHCANAAIDEGWL